MDKRDLHRLIDQLPEVQMDEAARLLVALLRQHGPREALMTKEDETWLDAGLQEMAAALADIEADVPAEELKAWRAAFDEKARPCTYVAGKGFVPSP